MKVKVGRALSLEPQRVVSHLEKSHNFKNKWYFNKMKKPKSSLAAHKGKIEIRKLVLLVIKRNNSADINLTGSNPVVNTSNLILLPYMF